MVQSQKPKGRRLFAIVIEGLSDWKMEWLNAKMGAMLLEVQEMKEMKQMAGERMHARKLRAVIRRGTNEVVETWL